MSSQINISTDDVKKIAQLANLQVSDQEVDLFAKQFSSTIEVINELNEIDTQNVNATYQVTGLQNITREDEISPENTLSQEKALINAKNTHQGYFVVNRIIDNN